MRVIKILDPETGEELDLEPNAAVYEEIGEGEKCEHQTTEIRRRQVKGGGFQHRYQCLQCGEAIGTAVSKAVAGAAPDFDEHLSAKTKADREKRREEIMLHHARAQRERTSVFWQQYEAYRETPAWKTRRDKVLARAGGICEGCGFRRATQAHHRSYEHLGHEFLFELVAVCDTCHDRLHGESEEPGEIAF
ncbi:hypothetical protein [Reyranella sp. CPCC 100927]|uniref:hypothetical protein n=1 Tax=Reyranella sp. CPCC 100927 TaxID=2599616 RepID=UPI0011B5C3EF|nr:hypothetical protein [Reyranella sp. CPCC 100927]TWS94983.1 hypothetical protein FQU96_40760 [Reyranella sp. CPCC 100927]